LAGAPEDQAAGIRLAVRLGSKVDQGDVLFILKSSTLGKIAYALDYYADNPRVIEVSM
jgi:thymidine phosphorylase